jgi:hypothetical protein
LETIDSGEAFALLVLVGIVTQIGTMMTQDSPICRQWGWRLAAAALVAYALYRGVSEPTADPNAWIHILVRGALAAGLALGVAWIVLSVLGFISGYLLGFIQRRILAFTDAMKRRRGERSRRLPDNAASLRAQLEAERRARQHQDAAVLADAKRRATDARAAAALAYSLYAAKVHQRFSQEMFDAFVAAYMGDNQPADDVERRGRELLRTLQQHLEEVEPPDQKRTLEDLARWFAEEKTRIESLPLEDKVKRLHIVELTSRYAELSSKLLQRLQP